MSSIDRISTAKKRTCDAGALCAQCGYDLRGQIMNPSTGHATCPECGTVGTPKLPVPRTNRRTWITILLGAALLPWVTGLMAFIIAGAVAMETHSDQAARSIAIIWLAVTVPLTYALCYAAMRVRSGQLGRLWNKRRDALRALVPTLLITILDLTSFVLLGYLALSRMSFP